MTQFYSQLTNWLCREGNSSGRCAVARWLQAVLVGVLGAWLAIVLWGGAQTSIRLATIHAEFRPALSGRTVIALPPFGTISAHTHRGPLQLRLRIEELHVEPLVEWVKQGSSQAETLTYLRTQTMHFLGRLIGVTMAVAMIGALIFGLLLGLRGGPLALGVGAGLLAAALPLLVAVSTFRVTAFNSPTYQGQLAQAPAVLQVAQQSWRNYAALEDRIPVVVDRIVRFYQQLDDVAVAPSPAEGDLRRVLHISDLHNNPLGLRFALDLAKEYQVDLVIVTGDITDLGHPLEADLLTRWRDFTVPVVVISGNHDSQSIMRRVSQLPGVTVLDNGETVTRAGLTIMGFGDPAAMRAETGSVDPTPEELKQLRNRIGNRLRQGPAPDVLLVHNHRVAEEMLGRVPIILTGHSHAAMVKQRGQSVLVNPGSTGAAGVRYFTASHTVPHGAAVLHVSRTTPSRLKLVDSIQVLEPEGNFVIRRQNIAARPRGEAVAAVLKNPWVEVQQ